MKIEELIKYLPYKLQVIDPHGVQMTVEGVDLHNPKGEMVIAERTNWNIKDLTPILIPLHKYKDYEDILDQFSEYSEEHFINSFFLDIGRSLNCLDNVNSTIAELMYKYHLDLYGLLDSGLATIKPFYTEQEKQLLEELAQNNSDYKKSIRKQA